jgi:hypothetical protein
VIENVAMAPPYVWGRLILTFSQPELVAHEVRRPLTASIPTPISLNAAKRE